MTVDMREIKSRTTLTLLTRKMRSAANTEQTTGAGEFCLFLLVGGGDEQEICVHRVKFEIL